MALARRPLVSVGVPVFNGEKGLARCLDSLLAQDYRNIEIVISDNGSTDAASEICALRRKGPARQVLPGGAEPRFVVEFQPRIRSFLARVLHVGSPRGHHA
jgi:GT2 family glycosyltransferase